jgi:hypothetical protein
VIDELFDQIQCLLHHVGHHYAVIYPGTHSNLGGNQVGERVVDAIFLLSKKKSLSFVLSLTDTVLLDSGIALDALMQRELHRPLSTCVKATGRIIAAIFGSDSALVRK